MGNALGIQDEVYAARVAFLKTGDATKLNTATYSARPDLFAKVDVQQLLALMSQSEINSVKLMAQTLDAILAEKDMPALKERASGAVRSDVHCFSDIHYQANVAHTVNNYLVNLATMTFKNPA